MANQEHLDILDQGVETWNQWRKEHPDIQPDFSKTVFTEGDFHGANFSGADLGRIIGSVNLSKALFRGADFRGAILSGSDLSFAGLNGADLSRATLREVRLYEADCRRANLRRADLSRADLSGANLSRADLRGANLSKAIFTGADLSGANLSGVDLSGKDLRGANLSRANLSRATLVETNFAGASLTNCNIYGIAAWNVELKGAKQDNLVITPADELTITIDNLKIAQFIYLLLDNKEIRDAIDTIAKKAVLILGRFTSKRKAVLDALKEALRAQGYLPILFDFDKPSSQDLTETVSTLAHLSRFIIVDLTDPSSAPYEVRTIASDHMRPIQALFQPSEKAKRVFAMFPDLRMRYHWVLPPYEYQDREHLLASLQAKVIAPAERKVKELAQLRAQEFEEQ